MNILTFDIEEWFHILDNPSTKTENQWNNFESRIHSNMDRIFSILDKNNVKATFFCLGWVAEKYPEIIKRIDEMGFEVATHSHLHQLAYEMNQNEFEEDLKKSIYTLEDITGKKIVSYRAPGFSIKSQNIWAIESLIKFGIKNDSSIFPANRSHGGISDFTSANPCIIDYKGMKIKEYPINVTSILGKKAIFSGGGYFRLFPYYFIKRFTKQTDYIMTYFHPRDFDAKQPMIEGLSLTRKFKSYYGLAAAEKKLNSWLGDFEFIDISSASLNIDWSKADVININ